MNVVFSEGKVDVRKRKVMAAIKIDVNVSSSDDRTEESGEFYISDSIR